jgi:hypothetical protein
MSRAGRCQRARAIEVPAAVHPHVRVEDKVAGERHQDVLATGGHRFDDAPDDGVVLDYPVELGVDRIEAGDRLSRQCPVESLGCPEDRIALRHDLEHSKSGSRLIEHLSRLHPGPSRTRHSRRQL